MRILVINPGATSTKIAVYEDETEVFSASLSHAPEELSGFSRVVDQLPLRERLVRSALQNAGYATASFDAVCSRGGLVRHIPSGTYAIDDQVIHDIYHPPFGEHASSLGPLIAHSIAAEAQLPAYLVDPVSVDELQPLARVTGLDGMERESFFHALNHKAVARKAALDLGKPYESLNLIVVHMGGGVSVAAHEKGRVVDVYNVKDEGSFSLDRAGSLPVNALVNLCYSGIGKQERHGAQAQKIELDQPHFFHPLHVKLGDQFVLLAAINGYVIRERALGNNHPGRMGGGVAVEPFQAHGGIKQAGHGFVGFIQEGQVRLLLKSLFNGHAQIFGHQLGDAVSLDKGNIQGAGHVAHHGSGLHLTKGSDLGHGLLPVFFRNIANNLAAPAFAKVHVDIGHADALGI